jgi:hypothetical protein
VSETPGFPAQSILEGDWDHAARVYSDQVAADLSYPELPRFNRFSKPRRQ